jgi:hypothetical protein
MSERRVSGSRAGVSFMKSTYTMPRRGAIKTKWAGAAMRTARALAQALFIRASSGF